MAITATPFTPLLKRFGYIAPVPPPGSWLTPIPRGEALFTQSAGSITAAAAGESQSFSITCSLPNTFAYVLMEFSIELIDTEVGDLADWDTSFRCFLQDGLADTTWIAGLRLDAGGAYSEGATLKGQTYQLLRPPTKLVVPQPAGGRFFVNGFNNTIDGGPVGCIFMAKFLEFDLNQAHLSGMNTPFPTR